MFSQEVADATAGGEFHGASEEDILSRIESGRSISSVANDFAVNRSTLWRWLEADPQRSARAREARQVSAEVWDDKAVTEINAAADPFALAKAKEIAYHYRWRASKIAPKVYGDKIEHEHKGGLDVVHRVELVAPSTVTPE